MVQKPQRSPAVVCRYESAAWADRTILLATLNDPSAWNSTLSGAGFVLDQAVGGPQEDSAGILTSARVLSFSYFLASDKELEEQQKEDEPARGWEQEFLDLLEVRPHCLQYVSCVLSASSL